MGGDLAWVAREANGALEEEGERVMPEVSGVFRTVPGLKRYRTPRKRVLQRSVKKLRHLQTLKKLRSLLASKLTKSTMTARSKLGSITVMHTLAVYATLTSLKLRI